MRSGSAATVVLVLGLAAGCATKGTDVAEVLADEVRSQGLPVRSATCERPGELQAGEVLTCTADLGGVPVPYEVTLQGDRRFQARPTVALITKADLQARLAEQTTQATGLPATVTCADAAVQTEATLDRAGCTATIDGEVLPLVVTLAAGARFTSVFARPVLLADIAERTLGEQVAGQSGQQATIDCGPKAVVLVPPGSTAPCSYRLADGRTGTLSVVVDAAGQASVDGAAP